MRTTLPLSVVAVLFVLVVAAAAGPCFGMISIAEVSPAKAKELGMEVRARAAGPDAVRVELEFKAEGALKSVNWIELEAREGGKLQLSSRLREDRSKPGRIAVSFTAARGQLDKITIMVVSGVPVTDVGYVLRVRDFVDPAQVR